MLQVARLAPKLLGESVPLVRDFLVRQQNPDGGFKDRSGRSDLYYTVFGLDGLIALEANFKEASSRFAKTVDYLHSFGGGEGMDFVHLCCLARAWSAFENVNSTGRNLEIFEKEVLARIENFRSKDGGYNPVAGSESGTAYGAFLALGAYQDLHNNLPEPLRLVQSLKHLETRDGAWTNERHAHAKLQDSKMAVGSTNATAAAVTVLRNLGAPLNSAVGDWLLARCHSQGGFLAAPSVPMPDLLSTATALHALAGMQIDFGSVKERCVDFVDSLWTNDGGFHGSWSDDALDCEYTFYGLLALGHLSL